MTITHAFTSPIYQVCFSESDLALNSIQEQFNAVYNKYKDRLDYTWGDKVLTSTAQSQHVLTEMPLLKDYIIQHIKNFMASVNRPIPITTINFLKSWVNCTKKDGYQSFHNHLVGPDLAGIYYFKTSGMDGDLKFRTDFGSDPIIYIKPKTGLLVIFPAYLKHAVDTNLTDDDRISLAFNCAL